MRLLVIGSGGREHVVAILPVDEAKAVLKLIRARKSTKPGSSAKA